MDGVIPFRAGRAEGEQIQLANMSDEGGAFRPRILLSSLRADFDRLRFGKSRRPIAERPVSLMPDGIDREVRLVGMAIDPEMRRVVAVSLFLAQAKHAGGSRESAIRSLKSDINSQKIGSPICKAITPSARAKMEGQCCSAISAACVLCSMGGSSFSGRVLKILMVSP